MDAGQILMQMSTGVSSTVSTPASAEMSSVPSAGHSDSIFADMLRGKSADVADTEPKGKTVTTDSDGEVTTLKPVDVNNEMISALLAVIDTRAQIPASIVACAGDNPETSDGSVQQDVLMSQNVVLLAAGPQNVLSEEVNDRMPKSNQPAESQRIEKTATSVQLDSMMSQNMPQITAGSQMALSAEGTAVTPESGLTVELQSKPDTLMPQNVTQLAAGAQLAQPEVENGRMPESVKTVKPQGFVSNLLQRSVRTVGTETIPSSAENGLSKKETFNQKWRSAESLQFDSTTPKVESILNGDTSAGKIVGTVSQKALTPESGMKNLGRSISANSSPAGANSGADALSAPESSFVQNSVKAKATSEQSGSSPVVRTVPTDVNNAALAENNSEQLDAPADVRVIRASTTTLPSSAISVFEKSVNNPENPEDGSMAQTDKTPIKKGLENVSTDVNKVIAASTSEKELLSDGGKDTSDHGRSGQFHQSAMQQQVKTDMGTISSTSGTAQKDAQHVDMTENVFRQVKEVLVNREVKPGNDQITLRLTPEHLGELTLNFKMDNQQLRVEIIAANRGVRDALMQHVENLKDSLSRQNITMESFDVVTSGEQRGFEQNDRGWKQLAQQQFASGTSAGGYRYRVPEVDMAVMPQYGMQKQYSMVDVHY